MDGDTKKIDLVQEAALRPVSLSDKYDLDTPDVFVTGTQALVRLCLLQAEIDRRAGRNTAGYVTGYRGSPLGAIDLQFAQADSALKGANITFAPALNEDLAATAIWGTQQAELFGEGKYDGVFGIWYGKGPGVDRTGDVFRHANLAGTSATGGVLALMGDDHVGESSTVCHQSEYAMMDVMIPVLNPANLEEMVDFGLHGWALSRYASVWCGIKCVKDNIESSASVSLTPEKFHSHLPNDFDMPEGGLNIRRNDTRFDQEARLHAHKIAAAQAYARANKLDRVTLGGGDAPRFGIISTGKSYMDVVEALADLGITAAKAEKLGLSVYKIGMSWPVEPEGLRAFANGLDRILVVEEKRGLVESQVKEILYGTKNPPAVFGKRDLDGNRLLTEEGSLTSTEVAMAIIDKLLPPQVRDTDLAQKHQMLKDILAKEFTALSIARTPYFCAGCPHNSSTVLPEGTRGYAGIGCHYMAQFMDREVEGFTHMGGEGANWIGEACFSHRKHIFQNIGDGTFNHSGLMAIRAAVAAGVNMTYKVLYNDAVAMTGGQAHEGGITPVEIAGLLRASGVAPLILVTDDLSRHDKSAYPEGMRFYHRSELQIVQKELAEVKGVSGLIYDQTCATEKRRRRKRGKMVDPNERIYINPEVCEGCGDCGVQSNCVAILPLETELGRKRQIDQSACNKDFSCIKGFCPSFVSVKGGQLRKPEAQKLETDLPAPPAVFSLAEPMSIVLTGVGGTGVVTIGALLGMAAHLEGKGCGIIDMAGLAQKGGAVTSHIRLAASPEDISAIRIGAGSADLLLGCDSLVSAESGLLKLMCRDGYVVANSYEMPTGDFTRNSDLKFPASDIARRLHAIVDEDRSVMVNATEMARALLGDAIAANLFLLGAAFQRGLIPLSAAAIEEAITLNNVAVEQSKQAFLWGRQWVADPDMVKAACQAKQTGYASSGQKIDTLEGVIADRKKRLADYQNASYGAAYEEGLAPILAADFDPEKRLSKAAARYLYKMMAIKDEYEVARLYSNGQFRQQIAQMFEGDVSLSLHLSPPLFAATDPATGRPRKSAFGSWVWPALKLLNHLRGLRGTALDIFGYTEERKRERKALADYRALLAEIAAKLNRENYEAALEIASLPEKIRGFGPVRHAHMIAAEDELEKLKARFSSC